MRCLVEFTASWASAEAVILAGLDFDEHISLPLAGDEVDFPQRADIVALQDSITLLLQGRGRHVLRRRRPIGVRRLSCLCISNRSSAAMSREERDVSQRQRREGAR